MFYGAYQLGDRLPLVVDFHHLGGMPDEAPEAKVYSAAGDAVGTYLMAPADPVGAPGLFQRTIHLDGRYQTGSYAVRIAGTVATARRRDTGYFRIVPGGDGEGAVIASYAYHRPHAEFLVMQLDSGKLIRGRNPFV